MLIPRAPGDDASLHAAIDAMRRRGRAFLADPILEPMPFGLTASILRYQRLRERYPDAPIMIGIGNLTELIEADTSGINAVLFGIAAELRASAVLTTAGQPRTRAARSREADLARRIMFAARETQSLPKGLSDALDDGARMRGRSPTRRTKSPPTRPACATPTSACRSPSDGVHVYNRDGHHVERDAFALWPQLALESDAAHAFYMGVELARAEIAWKLGKRYVQDQPLDWGVAAPREAENLDQWSAPGTTLRDRK